MTEDHTSLEEPPTQHIETRWQLLERRIERPKPGDDHCGCCIGLDHEIRAAEHLLGDYAVSPQWRRGLANQIGTERVTKEDVGRHFPQEHQKSQTTQQRRDIPTRAFKGSKYPAE